MKNSTLATRLMMAAIFLTVLVYFGLNLAAYFNDPYTTTLAYSYTGENAVTVSGYVVREEEVLAGGGELVYSARREGERVAAGGTVAQIYSNVQALTDANRLRDLTGQLEQLNYARSLTEGTQPAARLDEEISRNLISFRSALAAGNTDAAANSGESLRTAVLKRSYAYSGTGSLDATITSLEGEIAALSASTEAGATRITAPQAGLFSGLVDGYELVLDPRNILEMTPAKYRAIQPTQGAGGVGKMIYGNAWFYLTLMRSEDVKRLETGDTVTLRFQTGLDRDMEMRTAYISAEEAGWQVVVFTSQRNLDLTTLLRRQNAQVIFESYEGVRVPRSAVRVDSQPITDENGEPVLNEDGEPRSQSVTCVYCLWGNIARLKPVKVLWQEEEYILVAPDTKALEAFASELARESRRLRVGDQVITAAADIYDGMVIQ
ncbi:MAG: hypothetical protein K2N78_04265 [Oscillospiraceae bacterium]|nr:hypothetical protein [Oscillospiraceae bacterium]